jgi:hypothetical protein
VPRRPVINKPGDPSMFFTIDWFIDGDGRRWSVEAVDMAKQKVTLELVDRPQRWFRSGS